ncbi:MAG: cell division protein FtsL [Bacteroidetes bacterium]|nr:cell division protein FtsL [Bacteroidota bacterium]
MQQVGVNYKKRLIGVLVAILLPALTLFPVHQASLHREMIRDLQKMRSEMLAVNEFNRILAVEIAELANPDRISRIAENVLSMKKAEEEDLALVRHSEE